MRNSSGLVSGTTRGADIAIAKSLRRLRAKRKICASQRRIPLESRAVGLARAMHALELGVASSVGSGGCQGVVKRAEIGGAP